MPLGCTLAVSSGMRSPRGPRVHVRFARSRKRRLGRAAVLCMMRRLLQGTLTCCLDTA